MTFTIRLALPREYADVGALTVAAYLEDDLVPPGSSYDTVLRDAAARAEKAELWVAVSVDDVLLGTVTYCPPGSVYRELGRDDEGEFRMLAVAPAARGRGVGMALVRHCVDRSRSLGFRGVVLSSSSSMTTAHRLYERLGFSRRPDLDWSPIPTVTLLGFSLDL